MVRSGRGWPRVEALVSRGVFRSRDCARLASFIESGGLRAPRPPYERGWGLGALLAVGCVR